MVKKSGKNKSGLISTNRTVAENRRAKFEFFIEETFECGLMLKGSEVKSLRLGQCSINESHAFERNGEIFLHNMHIPEYSQAGSHLQHDTKREKKLLLRASEIKKLIGSVSRSGYTLVPLRVFFNDKGLAKLELGLGKGKKLHDKRETEKQRDWNKQKARVMKDHS